MDWQDIVRNLTADPRPAPAAPHRPRRSLLLDAAGADPEPPPARSAYEQQAIALEAVSVLQEWLESDDLEPGETAADRLLSLVVGIADADHNGEIDDDESVVVDVAREAMWDYLDTLGVEASDIAALLDDWDEAAAERVRDAALAAMPDGEFDADELVFGDDAQEAMFDATYRDRWAVRGGKKMRVRKRISGSVRLSGAQKLALRKARMKANSAGARARRLKSLRMRRKIGL